MRQVEAIKCLRARDQAGQYVYTNRQLAKVLRAPSERARKALITRLVEAGILVRAVRGVYVFALTNNQDGYTLERIAKALRTGKYSYVSLESALAEYGVISQVPVDRLTVMTTGRTGEYQTPYGVIEFTHTRRPLLSVIDSMEIQERPLRVAHLDAAVRDLKRVGRNTHLIDQSELESLNAG